MDKEKRRLVSCALGRFQAPNGYAGHHHYEQMILAATACIGGCMNVREFKSHDMPIPFSIMLATIAKHLHAGGCAPCRKLSVLGERQLLEAITAYRNTAHAAGPESLFRLMLELSVSDGSSGEEGVFAPLEAVEDFLRIRFDPSPLDTADTSPGLPAMRAIIR